MAVTNPYYEFTPSFVPGTKARSEDVNIQYQNIQNAFDFLPGDSDALTTDTAIFAPESGSGNSYVVTMPDTRTVNQDGDGVRFFATHTNTGAATLDVDGIGAVAFTNWDGTAFVGGELVSGQLYEVRYDATNTRFVLAASTDAALNKTYAQEWANAPTNTLITAAAGGNLTDDYSARHQADAAQDWAIRAEDSLIPTTFGGNGVDEYSAYHWAQKASGASGLPITSTAGAVLRSNGTGWDEETEVRFGTTGALYLGEQAAAEADIPTFGQLFVRSTDDVLIYRNEAGSEVVIGEGGKVLADIPVGDPPTTEAPTANYVIRDSDDTTQLMSLGFTAEQRLVLRNDFTAGTPGIKLEPQGSNLDDGFYFTSNTFTIRSTSTGSPSSGNGAAAAVVFTNRSGAEQFRMDVEGTDDTVRFWSSLESAPVRFIVEDQGGSTNELLVLNPHGNTVPAGDVASVGCVFLGYAEQFYNFQEALRTVRHVDNSNPTRQGSVQLNLPTGGFSEQWGRILSERDTAATYRFPEFDFDVTVTMADPGAGNIRFNNATIGSVTSIAVSTTQKDIEGGTGLTDFDFSLLQVNDIIELTCWRSSGLWIMAQVTGITDNTTWFQIDFTQIGAGATSPTSVAQAITLKPTYVSRTDGTLPASSAEGEILVGDGTGGWREGTGVLFQATAQPPTADEGYLTLSPCGTADVRRSQIFAETSNTTSTFAFFETGPTDGLYMTVNGVGSGYIIFGRENTSVDTDMFTIREDATVRVETGASFFTAERASADADVTAYGQWWSNSNGANPNLPYYTGDTGVDWALGTQLREPVAGALIASVSTTEFTISGYDQNDDGLVLEDGARVTFEDQAFANDCYLRNEGLGGGSGTLTLRFDTTGNFICHGGIQVHNGTQSITSTALGSPTRWNIGNALRVQGSVYMLEQSAADTDIAGDGQLWTKNTVPNDLWFTDDAGNDFPVAYAAARQYATNAAYDINTSGNEAQNGVLYYDNGSNYTVTLGNSTGTGLTNFPVGSTIQIIAPGSGVITVNEGTSTTLYLEDGTDTAGGCTMTQGAATVYRHSATVYVIIGSGITA